MSSAEGNCLCGNLKVTFTGDPAGKALCYCTDCQTAGGSAFSTNFLIPEDNFKFSGTPKTYTKKADSGNSMTNYFCDNCGTVLWREGDKFPKTKILKAGVLNGNAINTEDPKVELFTRNRPSWVTQLPGADQFEENM